MVSKIKLQVFFFVSNTPKETVYGRRKKLSKSKPQNNRNSLVLKKKRKEIKDIWTLFETEEEKKERKKIEKKKETNERLIKNRILEILGHLLKKKKIIIDLKK